ncbi:NAD(P)-binding protein [Dyella caseinilytica]|uniref:NAD(P)-binding protein n=1 Tax=Dyella caseinilytica TaxID=1849581 RepID=UPI00193EDB05|nr:NAD(P)-binding protein [Dyella caseinilytica]GFZ93396.1 hypothetical protein GCM10011408_11430 [Dyella caseinilytica]
MATQPQRIAILGGGVGAMTAAFWLTSTENWQQHYQIDVYQMGWRLGGKGASGRNAAIAQRIEEHGLHIWFGFYDNAFQLMQQAYAELDRPVGSPLATWTDAFKPQHYVCLAELIEASWRVWPIETPELPGIPGTPRVQEGVEAAIAELLDWQRSWLESWAKAYFFHAGKAFRIGTQHESRLRDLLAAARAGLTAYEDVGDPLVVARKARDLAHAAAKTPAMADWPSVLTLLQHLQQALHDVAAPFGNPDAWSDDWRRLYMAMDLSLAVGIGMLVDDVVSKGFEVINNAEFRVWLAQHGAQPVSVDGAPVRGFYDLVFAYRNGDPQQPNIEAGTMLRGMLKVGLGYRGALMYKMQAGMGDVVFAPLYDVLKRRGVRFHYFHKLCELRPDASNSDVEEIELEQQVALTADAYDPLIDVNGLPSWPSTPRYAQIDPQQATLLQQNQINLESHWSNWPEVYRQAMGHPLPRKILQRGVDFDQVVFGLSVASLVEVAQPLLAISEPLRQCNEKVAAVATQAYQLWLSRDLQSMGWSYPGDHGEEPVLSGFTEPFDTWASMDQLLCRETWPLDQAPKNIAYFCNALALASYPSPDDHDFPAQCATLVKTAAIHQLQTDMRPLWNNVGASGFPWEWLVDPTNGSGEARFDSQFWRANIDPSERYVLSLVDTSRYRLRTDQSGFSNLFLAGDWLKTGLDAGCVEAAVMGGMQASRAICGVPQAIQGEHGW